MACLKPVSSWNVRSKGSGVCLAADEVEDQTDNESQQRGKNPEQPELRQRQRLPQHREDAVQPAGGEQRRGQRGGEVIERADKRQRGRPDKDGAVIGEEFPEKGERDQRDGEGIGGTSAQGRSSR